jgi:hypothetical protein
MALAGALRVCLGLNLCFRPMLSKKGLSGKRSGQTRQGDNDA